MIVYASQTGTAEEVAREMEIRMREQGFDVEVCEVSRVSLKSILDVSKHAGLMVWLVATTGEGEPPDSLYGLWQEMLDSGLRNDTLKGLKFAVFGFGDSKYGDLFNAMARKIQKRLTLLGATEVIERGLGDQQDQPSGYRVQYDPWYQQLLKYFKEQKPQKVNFQICHQNVIRTSDFEIYNIHLLTPTRPFTRTTFSVSFATTQKYQPGDVLNILPRNREESVSFCFDYFKIDPNTLLKYPTLPEMPAKILFQNYLNLTDTLPFYFFSQLQQFCKPNTSQLVIDKLNELATSYSEYREYIKDYRRNFKQFVEDFPDVQIQLKYMLQRVGLLKRRQYSVASFKQNTVEILVRLVEKEITPYRTIKGLLSDQLLNRSQIGNVKQGYFTKGKLQYKPFSKYILVGIGTGVAPLLSIIEAKSLQQQDKPKPTTPPITFYFGNKTLPQIYYHQRLLQLESKGIVKLRVALSREPPKIHVQNLIKEDHKYLQQVIDKQTIIFICGTNHTFTQSISGLLIKQIKGEDQKVWRKSGRLITQFW